jgi:hypothetical protein
MHRRIRDIFLFGAVCFSTERISCADLSGLQLNKAKDNGRLELIDMVTEEAVASILSKGAGELLALYGIAAFNGYRQPNPRSAMYMLRGLAGIALDYIVYQLSRPYVYSPGRALEEKLLLENKQLRAAVSTIGVNIDKNFFVKNKRDVSHITNQDGGGFFLSTVLSLMTIELVAQAGVRTVDISFENSMKVALVSGVLDTVERSLETKYLYDPEGDRRCALATQNEQLRSALVRHKSGAAAGGITLRV